MPTGPPGLNSCSGEPAARGLALPQVLRDVLGVSIPVLVNLRLGAQAVLKFAAGVMASSQFLFW